MTRDSRSSKGKERRPVEFTIDLGLCMFCWLCVESCPFDALTMTTDYEQGEDDLRKLIRTLDDLTERGKDIPEVLRVQTAPTASVEAADEPQAGEPGE